MSLKYINAWDFPNFHFERPVEGSQWHRWWSGKEPKIVCALGREMWNSLAQAKYYFVRPPKDQTALEHYNIEKFGKVAYERIEQDLNHFINEIQTIIDRTNAFLPSPEDFEYIVLYEDELGKSDVLNKNLIQTMAAYSLYCLDGAIEDLLEKEKGFEVLTFSYCVTALNMCRDYIRQDDLI